jgi:hypothetical protein
VPELGAVGVAVVGVAGLGDAVVVDVGVGVEVVPTGA